MNLSQKVETDLVGWNDNQDWLGSAHGTQEMETITLDGAAVRAQYPSGLIPSGAPIGRAASGLYVPGDGDESDTGHLMHTVNVGAAAPAGDATNDVHGASLFWHGSVVVAKLPAGGAAFDQALRTLIRYV